MAPSLIAQVYTWLVVLAAAVTIAVIVIANARRVAGELAARDVPVTETDAEVVAVDRSNIWHAEVTFRLADGEERTFETEWYPRYGAGDRGRIRFRGIQLERFTPQTD